MRSRARPEEPGTREAGGSEAWPEALRISARTGGRGGADSTPLRTSASSAVNFFLGPPREGRLAGPFRLCIG